MNPTSFSMKTALLASLILSGQVMAQTLPDEINHPQYLKIYQNLEQVVAQKTAEYQELAAQKVEIEKQINAMVVDQQALPARNAELQRLIDSKRQELSRIQAEMTGLEGILSKILEDLRRIDAMIAQLQRDLSEESARSQNIQARRAQVAQDVARINNRLQQELAEEEQSRKLLNQLTRELNRDVQKKNENLQERQQLTRDVDRFKREIPGLKAKVTTNTQAVNTKKTQLADAKAKLPGIKAQINSEEAALAQANAEMAPKKTKLNELKAELARQMPEVTKLQKENTDLKTKIEANNAKITASGLTALVTKRDNLEKEVSSVNKQIEDIKVKIVALKEAIKPDLGRQQEVRTQIRELERTGANPAELQRLKAELATIEARLAPKRQEIARTEKQMETLVLSVAPKNQEIANLNAQITTVEASVANLKAENEAAKAQIVANQKIIDERLAANSGLVKEIADLEKVIAELEANRDRISRSVAQLKTQESTLTTQIAALTKDVTELEAEIVQGNKTIAEMEKAIVDYPLNIQRIDNHNRKLDEQIQTARVQISREEKLLARIQQDRVVLERDLNVAQTELNRVNYDLAQSSQMIGAIQNKLQEEIQNRETLTRYNQDSIRKYDNLKTQKAAAESAITDSNQEISTNNQDIATIAQELPRQRNALAVITPKVVNAEKAMVDAENKAQDASTQYQNRLSLYQRYLSDAQSLGSDRANLGTTDGTKYGAIEGRTKATRLATENAAAEAKWDAMRRGYIRGEIAGYENGFEVGMASSADASQGTKEGTAAGALRAKNHANQVLLPKYYIAELSRRLEEVEVPNRMIMASFSLKDSVSTKASMSAVVRSDIPELTQNEIDAARRILSSLDAKIEQSQIEIDQVLNLRGRLSDARGVYTAPGTGENANSANCTGVYKNVKEFMEACKASYVARYQGLYAAAYQTSFFSEYDKAFSEQIEKTFEAELARLYPGYLKEATAIGKDVGVSAGKKEIYQQSFARAEAASYSANIAVEDARVQNEAVTMIDTYLSNSPAMTLKGQAKIQTNGEYGIAPGAEIDLMMLLKNIGSKVANNSVLKITQSSNVVIPANNGGVPAIAPGSQAELSVMKLKVSDSAVPGSKVVIAGELVHSANQYQSARVETFRVESVIKVNPSIDNNVAYDVTPKVANLGFTKKHDIDVTLSPKFEGVEVGYEVSIEEVGSRYARFTNTKANTERLNRGAAKKVTFEYKLDKSAKGKTVNFKVTVKNDGSVIKTVDLQIKPQ